MEIIEKRIESLERSIDYTSLDERLKHANEIIRSQESLFSQYMTFFQVLAALLAIVVPFLIYVFGVLPTRRATRDLKKAFNSFMKRYQMDQIQEALNNIDSKDTILRSIGYKYLSNNYHYDFSDQMLSRIYSVLIFDKYLPKEESYTLMNILIKRKSKYADKYLFENFKSSWLFAAKYFTKIGIADYLMDISKKVLDREVELVTIIKALLTNAKGNYGQIKELINFPNIIEPLPLPDLSKAKNYLEFDREAYKHYPGLEIDDSLLYKIVLEKEKSSQES